MPFTRRDFLKTSSLTAAWMALANFSPSIMTLESVTSPANTNGALQPAVQRIATASDSVVHTLRRISFGLTPEMVEAANRLGLEAYIEEQLQPDSSPETQIEQLLEPYRTLKMPPAARMQNVNKNKAAKELISATVLRQWQSKWQVFEMMVDFWSNHFSIFTGKRLCRTLKTDDDQQVIRPHALGKFPALLRASAHSPAMLEYLDNAQSQVGAPNENYARELLELHTVGVDGDYTQQDVFSAAQVLTGWTFNRTRRKINNPGEFLFNPELHEPGNKQVMGLVIPQGGEEEGQALLDMLSSHAKCAHFISAKLARRFVSDSPSDALVNRLSDVFSASGGDTRELLRSLFTSDEFLASSGLKFKRPLEFFVSTLRVTYAQLTKKLSWLIAPLQKLGQMPFTWPTPEGFPDISQPWMTTSGLLNRWNFANQLTLGQIEGLRVDLRSITREADSPTDVVDLLSTRFVGEPLPTEARAILIDFASDGDLAKNLPSLAGLILGSPFFQMR